MVQQGQFSKHDAGDGKNTFVTRLTVTQRRSSDSRCATAANVCLQFNFAMPVAIVSTCHYIDSRYETRVQSTRESSQLSNLRVQLLLEESTPITTLITIWSTISPRA